MLNACTIKQFDGIYSDAIVSHTHGLFAVAAYSLPRRGQFLTAVTPPVSSGAVSTCAFATS